VVALDSDGRRGGPQPHTLFVRGRKTTEKGTYPFIAGWVKIVGWAAGMEGRGGWPARAGTNMGQRKREAQGRGRGVFLFSFIFKTVLKIKLKPNQNSTTLFLTLKHLKNKFIC
jgi:hypothetical protein